MAADETSKAELFDPEFLDRLRALFLRLRKRRQLRRKGQQSTPATGFTREFKDFRHYTPNDDYRAIDWRLYARLGRLFIRLFEEVQEFDVHILVDTSGSMAKPHPEKRAAALRLAVALAYLGLVSHHRVSLYGLGEEVSVELPPLKGQGNIQKFIDRLGGLEFGGKTDLERCFRGFRPGRGRYGIIFVLSDLFGQELGSAATALQSCSAWPGEPHAIHIWHPEERSPDLEGEIELVDVETGEARRMWLTRRERRRHEAAFDGFVDEVHASCVSRQIDYLAWRTDLSFEDLFLELLSRGSALAGG